MNVSSVTKHFPVAQEGFATTLGSTISSGAATVPLNSVAGYTNGDVVAMVIEPSSPTAKQVFTGTVDTSGVQITGVKWTEGTNQSHAAGVTVVDYTTATHISMMTKGIKSFANDDATLKTSAVQAALNLGTESLNGWNALGYAPNTVEYNGNRSYTCTFNGVDLTGVVSPGMRLMTTRTVAAPTRSTSLNGTSQYYSKTSPAGMTFITSWVAGAWVKLNSYPASDTAFISKLNGTQGWWFGINSSGQVIISGHNAALGNYRRITSYQSIPLNKWIQVTAQMDMAAGGGGGSSTTAYVMLDGVDVPGNVTAAGTSPVTLVQAGNLEIGTANAGSGFAFVSGKIAQAFVSSAKITQANVRAIYSQGLTPALITSNNIISVYSFDNSIIDLNTTNANNLTANGGAVATNADSPFGTQASGSISSALDYAEVLDATFSTNTTLTVRVPDGNTIPTSGGVSAVSYSTQKAPYGMPPLTNVLHRGVFMYDFAAPSSALADVSGYTATIIVPTGGRNLKIRAYLAQTYNSVDSQRVDWSIFEDGSAIQTNYNRTWIAGNGGNGATIVEVVKKATAGTHTYKLTCVTSSGSPHAYGSTVSPCYFEVILEDA